MKHYLRELAKQLTDDRNLVVELFLAWIAVAVTVLCVGTVAWYLFN